jgi:hypothetical protein
MEKKKKGRKDDHRGEDEDATAKELQFDSPKGAATGGGGEPRTLKRKKRSTEDVEGASLEQNKTLKQRKLEALVRARAEEEGETIPRGAFTRAKWMVNAIEEMRQEFGTKLEELANSVWGEKKEMEEQEAQARKRALERNKGETTIQPKTQTGNEPGISEQQIGSVVAAVLEGTGLVSAQEAQDGLENVGKGKGGKKGGDAEQQNERDMLRAKAQNVFEERLLKDWDGEDWKTLEIMVRSQDFLANMGFKDATAYRQREFVEKECMKLMLMRNLEEFHDALQDNEGSELVGQLMENHPEEVLNPEVQHRRLEAMLEMVRVQLMYADVANRYSWSTADTVKERFEKGVEYSTKMDKEASKIHAAKGKEKSERKTRKGTDTKGAGGAVKTFQHHTPRISIGMQKGGGGQQQRQQYQSNVNRWIGPNNPYFQNGKCSKCSGNHFARDAVCPYNQGGAGGAGGRGGGTGGGGGAYRGGR